MVKTMKNPNISISISTTSGIPCDMQHYMSKIIYKVLLARVKKWFSIIGVETEWGSFRYDD